MSEALSTVERLREWFGSNRARGVLQGFVCICGQHWPDFIRTEHPEQFRTECCGSVYQLVSSSSAGTLQTLSLIHNTHSSDLPAVHVRPGDFSPSVS